MAIRNKTRLASLDWSFKQAAPAQTDAADDGPVVSAGVAPAPIAGLAKL
ncbi:hypothetical protein RUR49_24915 [Pseudoxanthobacter sp. M-2]